MVSYQVVQGLGQDLGHRLRVLELPETAASGVELY